LKTNDPFFPYSPPPFDEAEHPKSRIPFGSLIASQHLVQTQGTQAPELVVRSSCSSRKGSPQSSSSLSCNETQTDARKTIPSNKGNRTLIIVASYVLALSMDDMMKRRSEIN